MKHQEHHHNAFGISRTLNVPLAPASAFLLAAGLLLLAASLPGWAASSSNHESGALAELQRHLPGLEISRHESAGDRDGPFDVTYFDYSSTPTGWPYGSGVAVWSRDSGALRWFHLDVGYCPKHTPRWVDFDGDGRDDLFFHAGQGETETTKVFLNRVAVDGFAVTNFVFGYSTADAYAVVWDPDSDGLPELLLPHPPEESDPFTAPVESLLAYQAAASACTDNERTATEIELEYRRVVGSFHDFNFYHDLGLSHEFHVVSLHGTSPRLKQAVRDHMRWRLRTLQSIRAAAPVQAHQVLDPTITFVRVIGIDMLSAPPP